MQDIEHNSNQRALKFRKRLLSIQYHHCNSFLGHRIFGIDNETAEHLKLRYTRVFKSGYNKEVLNSSKRQDNLRPSKLDDKSYTFKIQIFITRQSSHLLLFL